MKKIGLISDTHGDLPSGVFTFFESCDEIWHAGDIGTITIADQLAGIKPLRAVYGNIDGTEIRQQFPGIQVFRIEDLKVMMIHIGGYPGRYDRKALPLIQQERPGLFISGHSHILKVIYDRKYELLHINPGAAGNNGWHKVITYTRFAIEGKTVKDLEIAEVPRRTSIKEK